MDEGPQQSDLYRHFIDLLNGMLQIPLDFPGTLYRKARIGSNQIRGILQTVIDKRRVDLASGSASPQQDLLSFLLCNNDGSGNALRDDEIKDNIMLLLMAGHDTSVVTVTLILRYLALNPDCYQKVLQEQMEIKREKEGTQVGVLQWDDLQKMKYTWRAVQETLRLYPPAGGTWRKAIVDISFAGFSIPTGWKLFWTTRSTHKNAEYFEDPENFDPSRFEENGTVPYTFVPFGGGPQMCPGNEFARMVILVFIHSIVKNVKWDLVNVNEKIIANPIPTLANGLPIRLTSLY
ncbi:cytochrome P450 716B2 isoform X1 [Cryptomeria japonica]|uniref:cytochrome P450 716B2 isoform X1 n=1 Tax=Cryptomeria japonica TaxID=3369 RepID=UPI0027DA51EB|nr:cytochrome P450 716B2 isoform X1 [Cryptomeria japonica]